MYDQNTVLKTCMDCIQEKMEHFTNESSVDQTYPSLTEVEACLHKLDLPIVSYVYDVIIVKSFIFKQTNKF